MKKQISTSRNGHFIFSRKYKTVSFTPLAFELIYKDKECRIISYDEFDKEVPNVEYVKIKFSKSRNKLHELLNLLSSDHYIKPSGCPIGKLFKFAIADWLDMHYSEIDDPERSKKFKESKDDYLKRKF